VSSTTTSRQKTTSRTAFIALQRTMLMQRTTWQASRHARLAYPRLSQLPRGAFDVGFDAGRFPRRRQPATGPPGSYPDRTCSGWQTRSCRRGSLQTAPPPFGWPRAHVSGHTKVPLVKAAARQLIVLGWLTQGNARRRAVCTSGGLAPLLRRPLADRAGRGTSVAPIQ
jgi:hypothetical protein